jgi:endonuclease/exonuclease/phosphatase family metal-dependent hydrolase
MSLLNDENNNSTLEINDSTNDTKEKNKFIEKRFQFKNIKLYKLLTLILLFSTIILLSIVPIIIGNHQDNKNIKIIAWNLENFGSTKLKNEIILEKIKEIISDYDVILLSELEQSSCEKDSDCEMKKYFKNNYPDYQFFMSDNLGLNQNNNRGKEQYGILVKNDLDVEFNNFDNSYKYYFSRPPYYIYIKNKNIFIATVHISFTNAETEVIYLDTFFQSINGDLVLLGDLNICNPKSINGEKIRTNYNWLLDDYDNTNIANSCAYDRIITKKGFTDWSEPKIIRNENILLFNISDHFPISLVLN